ncbi:PhnD/SsuA/transferrin family substrate-binding protein [Propionivibrio dicarboxylicus]|uniref:Phosphonate transport system substrate-binding protein n=1 Tax=Propionivibrio dicarboxylicus TaxID=83767 RepID=A0A1G8HWU9_9RHOO|nr:PhnD/SsuA/transferrin family substrate-binding protein [Propionivibrio dicarboxylicus]SDI10991.1 phosphonate transport system substrate-binding protein [Propionivibrio dicarboxylicus]
MGLERLLRLCLAVWVLTASTIGMGAEWTRPIRVGMTPAFLHDQHAMLAEWKLYLQNELKRPVVFVQRDSYQETMDLIHKGKLDFAWLCDYPYIALGRLVKILAVASYRQQPIYHSYLIVPSSDTHTRSILDLKGKVFAYAAPQSNTGYVVPRYQLRKAGVDANTFFRKTFFTWSHSKAIRAVASGLAQGAAIDSYVWDSLQKVDPKLVAKTRIVWTSEPFGFPPIVADHAVSKADFQAFQNALFRMKDDPAGRALLDKLNLDGFVEGTPSLYKGVTDMMRELGDL